MLPSHQVVHFQPKIQGHPQVCGCRLGLVSATAPCAHVTSNGSREGWRVSLSGFRRPLCPLRAELLWARSEALSVPSFPQV